LELGIGAGDQKTRMVGLPWPRKKFDDIFSRLDTMHQRDRRTE